MCPGCAKRRQRDPAIAPHADTKFVGFRENMENVASGTSLMSSLAKRPYQLGVTYQLRDYLVIRFTFRTSLT